jgi:protein gp37
MPGKTKIEWATDSWNPVTGCSKVSPGCANCYAETLSLRWGWSKKPWLPEFAEENVILHPERLDVPIRWTRPRKIFVNSMSDMFHELVPEGYIDKVFASMALSPQHIFQVLTKRPERQREYMADVAYRTEQVGIDAEYRSGLARYDDEGMATWPFPLPNVWLGTSIENDRWTVRADDLRQTNAAVRFLSCEPLLGPLTHLDLTGLDWVIVGGESGPGSRPMKLEWALDLRDKCVKEGVPFFFKQMGNSLARHLGLKDAKGGNSDEWETEWVVRQFPTQMHPSTASTELAEGLVPS